MSSSVKPNAKVGILYQNDDFGRDFLGPFKKVLADAGGTAKVIMEQSYDLTEPTVDLAADQFSKSGADVFYNITDRQGDVAVDPQGSGTRLEAAAFAVRGLDRAFDPQPPPVWRTATGIVAIRYAKEVGAPRLEKDPDVMAFEELRKKYLPTVDPDNTIAFAGYGQVASDGGDPAPLRRRTHSAPTCSSTQRRWRASTRPISSTASTSATRPRTTRR